MPPSDQERSDILSVRSKTLLMTVQPKALAVETTTEPAFALLEVKELQYWPCRSVKQEKRRKSAPESAVLRSPRVAPDANRIRARHPQLLDVATYLFAIALV